MQPERAQHQSGDQEKTDMERHWCNIYTNQGLAKVARQKLGEKHGIHSTSGPSKGNIHSHLDLDFCPWKLLNNTFIFFSIVYCHPVYLIYMQSISYKMLDWMKPKME